MARPCFPFPTNCTVATLWDGTTLGPSGVQSGSSSVDSLVVGAGTPYPVGLTLAQCAELFFKVRLWSASFTVSSAMEVSYDGGIYYGNPGSLAMSGALPLVNGIVDCSPYETNIFSDFWTNTSSDLWKLKEASGALGNSMRVTASIPDIGPVPLADFLTGSDNYTVTELNDVLSFSLTSSSYCSLVASSRLLYCDGLYYPEVVMEAASWSGLYGYSNAGALPVLAPDLTFRTDRTAGNLTFELPSGDITIPIYLYVADQDLTAPSGPLTFVWSITSASFNITVTPVKYWPYKDKDGVAKYDETTGAPV